MIKLIREITILVGFLVMIGAVEIDNCTLLHLSQKPDVDGMEIIGKGSFGSIYKEDENTVLKQLVLHENDPLVLTQVAQYVLAFNEFKNSVWEEATKNPNIKRLLPNIESQEFEAAKQLYLKNMLDKDTFSKLQLAEQNLSVLVEIYDKMQKAEHNAEEINRENRIMNELKNDEYVVSIIDCAYVKETESAEGIPDIQVPIVKVFLRMEKAAEDLQSFISKGSTNCSLLDIVANQLAIALHMFHEKGYIHRDLKPGNVLVMPLKVVLADLGLVTNNIPNNKRAGTPFYAPYEQLGFAFNPQNGRVSESPGIQYDQSADIFAMGIILAQLYSQSIDIETKSICGSGNIFYLINLMTSDNPAIRPNTQQILSVLNGDQQYGKESFKYKYDVLLDLQNRILMRINTVFKFPYKPSHPNLGLPIFNTLFAYKGQSFFKELKSINYNQLNVKNSRLPSQTINLEEFDDKNKAIVRQITNQHKKSLSALTLSKSSFQSSIGSEIDTSFLTLSDNSSAHLETMQNVKSIVLSMESKNRIPTGEESMNFMHLLNNYSINLHTKGVDFGRTQKNIKGFRKKIEALNAIHQRIENNIKAVLANTQISNKKKVEMINQHKNQVKHNGLEDFDFII